MTVVETALPSVGPGSLQNRLTKSPQTSSLVGPQYLCSLIAQMRDMSAV